MSVRISRKVLSVVTVLAFSAASLPLTATAAPPPPAEVGPKPKTGGGLIAGGAVMSAIGLGGIGLFAAGAAQARAAEAIDEDDELDKRRDQVARGKLNNTLAFAGIAAAAATLPVGILLIALGVDRRRRARGVAVAPTVHPRMTGVVMHVRF